MDCQYCGKCEKCADVICAWCGNRDVRWVVCLIFAGNTPLCDPCMERHDSKK